MAALFFLYFGWHCTIWWAQKPYLCKQYNGRDYFLYMPRDVCIHEWWWHDNGHAHMYCMLLLAIAVFTIHGIVLLSFFCILFLPVFNYSCVRHLDFYKQQLLIEYWHLWYEHNITTLHSNNICRFNSVLLLGVFVSVVSTKMAYVCNANGFAFTHT